MARPHPALIELAAGRPFRASGDRQLLDSALEHRMGGLLLSAIHHADSDGSRPDWTDALEIVDLGIRGDHQRQWEALDVLRQRLDGIGVDFAVAKGVPAERRWYDRVGERPCADIDILIAPHHRHRFGDVLLAIQPGHEIAANGDRLAARGLLQSLEARIDGTGEQIDVHVDLLKMGVPVAFDQSAWQRMQSLTLPSGAPLRVLDAESQLVHFAVHANKGRFACLLWHVDILRLTKLANLDTVFQLAAESGVEGHVRSTIEHVHTDVGLVPPIPRVRTAKGLGWDLLWPASSRLHGPDVTAHRHPRRDMVFLLSLPRQRRAALRFFWHRIFPGYDARAVTSWGESPRSTWGIWLARLRRERIVPEGRSGQPSFRSRTDRPTLPPLTPGGDHHA